MAYDHRKIGPSHETHREFRGMRGGTATVTGTSIGPAVRFVDDAPASDIEERPENTGDLD